MREDSRAYESGPNGNRLHFHDGGTCHGSSSLSECAEQAISNAWVGKILEVEDRYRDGTVVKCYSLIAGAFDHHGKRGRYVADVKMVVVPIEMET